MSNRSCFNFINSEEPDEMQQAAAFHLGLYCLQKYSFRGFLNTKGKVNNMSDVQFSLKMTLQKLLQVYFWLHRVNRKR